MRWHLMDKLHLRVPACPWLVQLRTFPGDPMRRTALLPLLTLALAAPAAQAQEFHPSITIDLIAPTGGFYSKTYAPTVDVLTPQTEAYDVGLGVNFGLSFPT